MASTTHEIPETSISPMPAPPDLEEMEDWLQKNIPQLTQTEGSTSTSDLVSNSEFMGLAERVTKASEAYQQWLLQLVLKCPAFHRLSWDTEESEREFVRSLLTSPEVVTYEEQLKYLTQSLLNVWTQACNRAWVQDRDCEDNPSVDSLRFRVQPWNRRTLMLEWLDGLEREEALDGVEGPELSADQVRKRQGLAMNYWFQEDSLKGYHDYGPRSKKGWDTLRKHIRETSGPEKAHWKLLRGWHVFIDQHRSFFMSHVGEVVPGAEEGHPGTRWDKLVDYWKTTKTVASEEMTTLAPTFPDLGPLSESVKTFMDTWVESQLETTLPWWKLVGEFAPRYQKWLRWQDEMDSWAQTLDSDGVEVPDYWTKEIARMDGKYEQCYHLLRIWIIEVQKYLNRHSDWDDNAFSSAYQWGERVFVDLEDRKRSEEQQILEAWEKMSALYQGDTPDKTVYAWPTLEEEDDVAEEVEDVEDTGLTLRVVSPRTDDSSPSPVCEPETPRPQVPPNSPIPVSRSVSQLEE